MRRLFPSGYVEERDIEYKHLVPINNTLQKTSIVNLRQELRNPVLECFNREYMLGLLQIVPLDLASCHAAIFAGLGGKMMAPFQPWGVLESKPTGRGAQGWKGILGRCT